MRQQDLRGAETVFAKDRFVYLNKSHLTNRSGSLQVVHGMWPAGPAKTFHALRNCARRDQQDLKSKLAELGDLPAPALNGGDIKPSPFVCDQRRSHLDDDPSSARRSRTSRHAQSAHQRLRHRALVHGARPCISRSRSTVQRTLHR